jgi:hypothetical protein
MGRKNGTRAVDVREIEVLESRLFLSVSVANAKGGPAAVAGPAIRLDLVALHEFGHALGLDHNDGTAPGSIMNAYYNANYDLSKLATDQAALTLQSLFSNVEASPWKDSLDPHPDNGVVDITYSFMPDGTSLDQGRSNLFSTFNALASTSVWQKAFTDQLDRWAGVSKGKIHFELHSDSGRPFNYAGAAQNDEYAGDIRIGGHKFDGRGKVLAHTYFPPPNGVTAAGDAHFDTAENWVLGAASATLSASATSYAATPFEGSAAAGAFSAGRAISADDLESDGLLA